MNQTNNNGRIAGVHVATLLRNLEDSTINEGSHDLFCRCKDAFAVLDSLLSEQGPRAGLYSLLSEDDSRAAGLAEAVALLPTIMADTFKRDDCTEEFLNGMAYGVASYCSAIKALAAVPASASTANEERVQTLEQGAQAAQAAAWRTVCAVLEEVQPGWGITPGTGIDAALFAIRGLAARRPIDAQQTEPVAVFEGFEDCGHTTTPRFRVSDSTKLRAGMSLYAGPTDGTNAEVLELHRRLAAEKLRADQGWQRYEAANADRNTLRASVADRVAQPTDDVAQIKGLWQTALANAALYVEAHCVDGERHARHIMEQPIPKIRARGTAKFPAALAATHGPLHLTNCKTADIITRGYNIVGYVLRRADGEEVCLSAESAVRWLPNEHYRRLMHEEGNKLFAAMAPADADLLSALLWLYRRLPRGYGRQDHIERPIMALAAQTGTDVAADLAERGQPVTENPARAIDTLAGQPFSIVHGYRVENDQPALACFTGSAYEFADGDGHERAGDTLAGFPAEFLTLFQLEQRLVAAAPSPAGCPACRQKVQEDAIVDAAHAAGATGQVELTLIDQRGIDRPTDIAKAFVRELGKFEARHQAAVVKEDLHTGVRATDVAQVLNDLELVGGVDAADVHDVADRAAAVIRGLLKGLSASQLSGVGGPGEESKLKEAR